jgi:glycosyltransferase involved in cell wall biosynthesis
MQTLVADLEPVVICSVLPEVMSAAAPRDRHEGGEMTYGIVGRLAPWKGQDLFLRAFAAAFPDGRERAVVVGAALFGEDEYARRLVGLAASLGIAGRVELRGFRSDVWSELARIDVLVHASVTPEPFGQVILEGMAAGVPVIAARAGGPAEILTHDVTGELYEPDDAAALAAAMTRLHDPQLRARLSAAALEEVRRYEPGVVAAQLHELYDAVAARRHARR